MDTVNKQFSAYVFSGVQFNLFFEILLETAQFKWYFIEHHRKDRINRAL